MATLVKSILVFSSDLLSHDILFFFTSLLEYNCLTMVCQFLLTYPISPPSCTSLPPSLSHPSRWSQSTELISLCYVAASHWLSILHLVVYMCPCYSLTLSQLPLPPSPCRQVHSLHLHLYSCPAPRFIRTIFFLDSIYMVSIWYLFFSF